MAHTVKQSDTAPNFTHTLTLNNSAVPLTNANTVEIKIYDKFERLITTDDTNGDLSIEDAEGGVVSYDLDATDTEDVGEYEMEFEVLYLDGEEVSYPNDGYVKLEVIE